MKKLLLIIFISTFIKSNSQTVGLVAKEKGTLDDGYVLFSPNLNNTTFLIDKCGKQMKTWYSNYLNGRAVYLLPNGILLRTGAINNPVINGGGGGGIIEKIDWEGNVNWSYVLSNEFKRLHHDIMELPNGNILAIVWVLKTKEEAIAMGRNPDFVLDAIWSEQIIEIEPIGTNEAKIVWEWNVWDHLVQNLDNTKPNYGVIEENPQLININYPADNKSSWLHFNALDYNTELDQIIISVHSFSEIWIIDHSTSKEEVATHAGGKSGKGGDLLYRWGNPAAYNNSSPQKLFGQHNVQWIKKGLPFENQIMIYNNGRNRPGGNYSTLEIINPPLEGNNYNNSLPFGPDSYSWMYNDQNEKGLYSNNISGVQQLSNGNVLFCDGPKGEFKEIDTDGNLLWKYILPIVGNEILPQGSTPTASPVFRCTFYPKDYSGFAGRTLTSGSTIEDTNELSEACSPNLSNSAFTSISDSIIYPNPANDKLNIDLNLFSNSTVGIQLINTLGQVVFNQTTSQNQFSIPLTNYNNGVYFLKISDGSTQKTSKIIIRN